MAIDQSRFTKRKSDVNSTHVSQQAANTRGRFLAHTRGTRQKADTKRSYGRSHEPFVANHAQRGLVGGGVRSGAFQKALQQRTGNYVRGAGRLESDLASEQRNFDLNSSNIDKQRNDALRAIEDDRQRQIAMAALNLRAMKPLYG